MSHDPAHKRPARPPQLAQARSTAPHPYPSKAQPRTGRLSRWSTVAVIVAAVLIGLTTFAACAGLAVFRLAGKAG